MEKVMEFMMKYWVVFLPVITFIAGRYLEARKFHELGKKLAEKLPEGVPELIAERMDAFEQGMLNKAFRGDNTIIANHQLKNGMKELREGIKVDLNLKE